jgi:hypothetical protein
MQINIKNNARETKDRFKREELVERWNPSGRKEEKKKMYSRYGRPVIYEKFVYL